MSLNRSSSTTMKNIFLFPYLNLLKFSITWILIKQNNIPPLNKTIMKKSLLLSTLAASSFLSVQAGNSLMSLNGQFLMNKKINYWKEKINAGELPKADLEASFSPQTCNNTADVAGVVFINGEAFPCKDVDFKSFIPLTDMNIDFEGGTFSGSDIWGWEDTETGKEYTLLTVDNGMWIIDTTDPENPIKVAVAPNPSSKEQWADVKVYKNTAYVVKDRSLDTEFDKTYGIQVFDLSRLRDIPEEKFPFEMKPDSVDGGHGRSHNIAVNTETGYAYTVGSTKCKGGPYVLNLEPDPLNPVFEACIDDDGYTHDAQIVIYDGPDERFTGREILFGYNEDTLTIHDVTDKQNIQRISRTGYPTASYTHQGWLTADMRWVFLNDELDEYQEVVNRTTTYIVDVSDLRNPVFGANYTHRDVSIDHNLYNWGAIHAKGWGGSPPYEEGNYSSPAISNRFMYLSNYAAGLRILDLQGTPDVSEAGFFDTSPDIEGNEPVGIWSNYMHPSGNIAVSTIERGLFILRPRDEILYTELVETNSPTIVPTAPTPPTVTSAPTLLPTSAPIVCEDTVPTGMESVVIGGPLECVDLEKDCSLAFIRELCPVTCELCIPKVEISTDSLTDMSSAKEEGLVLEAALTFVVLFLLVVFVLAAVQVLWNSRSKSKGSGADVEKKLEKAQKVDAIVSTEKLTI
eukprot:snap_masked-scaffold_37-processed-gene-2.79-mRNA-1 protein AED:1.00 eAED:1.00 QI:0/0/0/0/1/1/2/0/684